MPELPEVETIARGVDQAVRGDRIVKARFSSLPQPFKTPPKQQAAGLVGRRILQVHRIGKHLVCELGACQSRAALPARPQPQTAARPISKRATKSDRTASTTDEIPCAQWVVHLGMTGRLLVGVRGGLGVGRSPVAPHTHATLTLDSGRELRFVDPRRFGRLEFRDLQTDPTFIAPGREPLEIQPDEFWRLFRDRQLSIKAALLNQSLLAGVGNIYADESLFQAGIRPSQRAGRLSRTRLERLRVALQSVLEHSIELGGSSVSDYVNADGQKGFYQLEHRVYRRTGQPCTVCGSQILRTELAGRGTHYCPRCQT